MNEYIFLQRNRVTYYVATRPIFEIVEEETPLGFHAAILVNPTGRYNMDGVMGKLDS